jgi:SAM-dependent methyltransferase
MTIPNDAGGEGPAVGAEGSDFYDDEQVFATYMARRRRSDNPNDTIEGPALAELLGPTAGLRVLDLGCGDARFGRELLTSGCRSFIGLEASRNMASAAREVLVGTAGRIVEVRIEDWEYPTAAFDLVVSRLALHYIDDLGAIVRRVYRALVPGGRFVFSVEHPVITSCDRGWPAGTQRQDWVVDEYHQPGRRQTTWLGGEVVKYHRTIEGYFGALVAAGFSVQQLREGAPQRERFASEATYQRRLRIPLFLLLAARKPEV